jgi:PAS domain S-box-containing protein
MDEAKGSLPDSGGVVKVDLGRFATDDSPLAMLALEGGTHRIMYANAAFGRLTGASSERLVGRTFEDSVPEGPDNGCIALLQRVFESKRPESLADQVHRMPGAEPAFWSYHVWPIGATADRAAGLMVQVSDTTDRVIARRQLVAMNQQLVLSAVAQMDLMESSEVERARLTAALRETNHRIKNSLQMVSALIDIAKVDDTHNPELERVRTHVGALVRIHDLITRTPQPHMDTVSLPAAELLDNLLCALEVTMNRGHLFVDVDVVSLPAKKATAIALIVNECVMNAAKHGAGDVYVSLNESGGTATLRVYDTGTGFPAGFDPVASANTGLELIQRAAEWDLGGQAAFDNAPGGGARITINFPGTSVLAAA